MIVASDGHDDDHDDDRWWYLQQEHEEEIFQEHLKEWLRERGEKTAAALKTKKKDRLDGLKEAMAPILAKRSNLTNKEIAYELKKMDPERYGSGNTIRLIGQVRRASKK